MRDIDQIHDDIQPENAAKFEKPELDPDLPGMGQFYCIPCAYVTHLSRDKLESKAWNHQILGTQLINKRNG